MRELAHEPRLAGAGLAREQHEPALAALGSLEQRAAAPPARSRGRRTETASSGTSGPGSGPRSSAADSSRSRGRSSAASWMRICLLELPQLGARLDPELVERGPRVAVRLQRLRLPARAVQREHQLAAQPLAMRMLRDQRLQLADELGVPAQRQVGLDPLLERRQPQLLEPAALDPRERLLAELRQRRAAPQRQRLAQQPRRTLGVGVARLGDEPLEARQVDQLRLDLRAGSPAAASCSASGRQHLPQPRDVHLHGLDRRPGGSSPQSSSISRSRATTRFAFSSSSASSARCFAPPSGSGPSSVANLQRPEDPVVHPHSCQRACSELELSL